MIQSRRSHIVHVNGRAVALWLRAVVVIAMIGCVWMTGARAGVLEVDDGDTAGLISAINTALADPMIDTINLASNGEYVLTAPADFFSGANGLPQIYSALVIKREHLCAFGPAPDARLDDDLLPAALVACRAEFRRTTAK